VVDTEGGNATVMLRDLVLVVEFESVTCTVKLLAPAAVGTPEIAPVAAVSVNPTGRVPDAMAHVYGGVPDDAARVAEYEAF
jgi:hypothetical protein